MRKQANIADENARILHEIDGEWRAAREIAEVTGIPRSRVLARLRRLQAQGRVLRDVEYSRPEGPVQWVAR